MKKESLIKFAPKKELILAAISLVWMCFAYYTSNIYEDNMLYTLIVAMVLTLGVVNVGFPVWWIAVHNMEGLKGLGITTRRLGISLLFALVLAAWRFLELKEYIGDQNLGKSLLYNALSIWEVIFLYGWLFTRFEKSFGKIIAVILTAISVGLYHIGTLPVQNILYLCVCVLICGICFSVTENIFTLWPIYWTIGCTASTMKSSMSFSVEMIILSGIILLVHIIWIIAMHLIYVKKSSVDQCLATPQH
jgi:hypothetical protein